MINLVQGQFELAKDFLHKGDNQYVGALYTPNGIASENSGKHPFDVIKMGMKWAMDNGCYQEYIPEKIIKMMKLYQGIPECLFMVSPDSVGNHDETMILFRAWLGAIQNFGFPIAFVLQDGVTIDTVPFDSIDAIFIGGTTQFKYSDEVRAIVKIAKERNKWVHCGRVNSINRLQYMKSIGCDSFDGSGYTRWMTQQKKHPQYYASEKRQMNLWEMIE